MNNLPPLTERIDKGAAGGHEFERLINQLLIAFANAKNFAYEPAGGAGGDDGVDGLARRGGVHGFGGPVAFQCKWLWGNIHKSPKAAQITDSLRRAAAAFPEIRYWILVTPHDLTPAEKKWLLAQKPRPNLTVDHWGQARVESLLREYAPKLFARYYPHEAATALPATNQFVPNHSAPSVVPGPPLPPITSLITGPEAPNEFCRLIFNLLTHEVQRQGCTFDDDGTIGRNTIGFTTWVETGKFCGLESVVAVSVSWFEKQDPDYGDKHTIMDQSGILFGHSPEPKHWVFVTPLERKSRKWDEIVKQLREQGVETHNFHQPHIEEWLRSCPLLLARYCPQVAADLPNAGGFSGRAWTDIRDEYLRLSLAARRDLRVERMSARHTEDEGRPVSVQLPDVFVPQQFIHQGQPATKALSLSEVITWRQPKVLLGDPGSGKSTVLSALALAAGGKDAVEDTVVPKAVPLFLALRRFSRERQQRPRLLDALVHHARSLGMAPGDAHPWFFEGLLEMGEAIVLFDGLDEAGDRETRKWVIQQIEEFHRRYPICPIWVTSRKVGYDSAPLNSKKFTTLTVAPFDKPRRNRFVLRWYTDQYREEPAQGKRLADSLCQAVDRSRPDVQRMAGNPLLLTLMALIHRSKRGFLPHNRGELYEECVELLLDRWEKAKRELGEPDDAGGDLAALSPPLDRNEIRRYLTTIAFEIQEKNENRGQEEWGNIPSIFLRTRLTELRQKTRRDPDDSNARADVEVLLRYIQDRAGLLVWNGEDAYAFSHLSFQEYLAACKRQGGDFRLDDHVQFFAKKAAEPKWRETLVLLLHRIQTHSTSEQPFTDLLMDFLVGHAVGRAPAQAQAVWRTLGMALRDEIPFAPAHQKEILSRLVREWLDNPKFEGESLAVLEDIALFSPPQHPLLTQALNQSWQEDRPARSLAALHLRVRLLGWPVDLAESRRLAQELVARLPQGGELAKTRPLFERAGRLLGEAKTDKLSQTPSGAEAIEHVQKQLATLMLAPKLAIQERDASAQALGWLNDPRPGVGVDALTKLPKLEWALELPVDDFKLGENEETIRVERPYRLSRYPVTVVQFQAFVEAGGYGTADGPKPSWWSDKGWRWRNGRADEEDVPGWYKDEYQREPFPILHPKDYDIVFQTPNHPRVGVCWFEAEAFCAWLTEQSRQKGIIEPDDVIRLPHEAEWEQAARWNKQNNGADARTYPWGESDKKDLAQHCNWHKSGLGHTSAVGLFPSGQADCGALDMSGNVWEWCVNQIDEGRTWRVLRGGSWAYVNPGLLRCSFRRSGIPGFRRQDYGFRCVWCVVGSAPRCQYRTMGAMSDEQMACPARAKRSPNRPLHAPRGEKTRRPPWPVSHVRKSRRLLARSADSFVRANPLAGTGGLAGPRSYSTGRGWRSNCLSQLPVMRLISSSLPLAMP